jgi:hypothetical protein
MELVKIIAQKVMWKFGYRLGLLMNRPGGRAILVCKDDGKEEELTDLKGFFR